MKKLWVLKYTEYGWGKTREDTTIVIGVFESEKLAEDAETELYLKRGYIDQYAHRGRSGVKLIDGKYYSVHGSIDIEDCELNKVSTYGI